jgi:hypothetical protein
MSQKIAPIELIELNYIRVKIEDSLIGKLGWMAISLWCFERAIGKQGDRVNG